MKRVSIRWGMDKVAGIIIALTFIIGICAPVSAQSQRPGDRKPTDVSLNANGDSNVIPLTDPRSEMPTLKVPDVHIVIGPNKDKFSVSAVYAAKVPRSVADAHLKALLDKTGWKAEKITFEDGQVTNMTSNDPSGLSQVMSSMTFETDAPVIDKEGIVTLEPFLIAFRDRTRVNLTFIGRDGKTPKGPKSFDDDNVQFQTPYAPGALTYYCNIKNHDFTSLNLPRVDAPEVLEGKATGEKTAQWSTTRLVSVIGALCVGVIVMTVLILRNRA